ncbi:jg17582 [Pararge aegeria aegeria]|uniref:Jg17582 protein n=1 Tax=Pararge aegeria aegeria TaxID=348720 RepID=A0A8S4RNL7_9NEOP|nr:jg17582 [Pararge aegeria aegeria]
MTKRCSLPPLNVTGIEKATDLDALQLAREDARCAGVGPIDPHHLCTCTVSHVQLERSQPVAEVANPPAGDMITS